MFNYSLLSGGQRSAINLNICLNSFGCSEEPSHFKTVLLSTTYVLVQKYFKRIILLPRLSEDLYILYGAVTL